MEEDIDANRILTRTYSIHQRPTKNSLKELVFKNLTNNSKKIRNSTQFLISQWHRIYLAQITYIANNLDQYIDKFSIDDREKICKHLYYTKNKDNMEKVISTSHPSEELNELFNTSYKTLSIDTPKFQPSNYMSIRDELNIFKEMQNNNIILKKYNDDSIDEYVLNMMSVLEKDSINKEETKRKEIEKSNNLENESKKKTKLIDKKDAKRTKKSLKIKKPIKSKKDTDNEKTDIIMSSFPRFTILDLYIKMYYKEGKLIGSQCVQQTIKKVLEAYKSFFKKRVNDKKTKKPKYLKKEHFNVVFQNNSFNIIDMGKQKREFKKKIKNKKKARKKKIFRNKKDVRLRLSLGLGFKKEFDYNKIRNIDQLNKRIGGQKLEKSFIYIKLNKSFTKLNIIEVELKPIYDGLAFKICIKYEKENQIDKIGSEKRDTEKSCLQKASIDTGIVNLITMYIPEKRPLIISGTPIVSLNKHFKKRLANLHSTESKSKDKKEKEEIRNTINKTWIKREHTIKDMFHKITTKIITACGINDVTELVIGYNKNWKQKVKMGKKNNFNFHYIPYRMLLNQLFYKGEEKGIKVIEVKESYTSKCDAFNLEEIRRQKKYSGKRIKRGLFISKDGTKLNGDVNGAINIMRKYIDIYFPEKTETLNGIIKKTKSSICFPWKIKNMQTLVGCLKDTNIMTTAKSINNVRELK